MLHVLEAQAEAVQQRRIHIHPHGGQRAAADVDLADPFDLQQPLLDDRGGRVVQLAAVVNVRGQRENHDRRVGGIDFAIGRIARQVGGQIGARGIDGGLHVARRAVDVAVQIKLQRDAGGAEVLDEVISLTPGDVAELPFQRRGDGGRHDFRTGARQRRAHGDGRKIHLRQRRDRQLQIRHRARQRNRRGQQRRADRTADEWRGNVHASSAGRNRLVLNRSHAARENFAASRPKNR